MNMLIIGVYVRSLLFTWMRAILIYFNPISNDYLVVYWNRNRTEHEGVNKNNVCKLFQFNLKYCSNDEARLFVASTRVERKLKCVSAALYNIVALVWVEICKNKSTRAYWLLIFICRAYGEKIMAKGSCLHIDTKLQIHYRILHHREIIPSASFGSPTDKPYLIWH